jgi:hypothetical protein
LAFNDSEKRRGREMRNAAIMVLSLLVSLALVAPAHADGMRIKVDSDEKYPSIEYAEFVGLFGSILIEEIGKADVQKFAPIYWTISLSNEQRGRAKITLTRKGEKQPVLTAVLDEDASFVEIQQVVGIVIEVVQRGGVE